MSLVRPEAGQAAARRLDDIVADNARRNIEFTTLYFASAGSRKAIKQAAHHMDGAGGRVGLEPASGEL